MRLPAGIAKSVARRSDRVRAAEGMKGVIVRSAGQRAPGFAMGGRGSYAAALLTRRSLTIGLIIAISAGFLWLVWIYASGLRDPRYLDGWVLACGMILQLAFHILIKKQRLTPKSAVRWKKFHIFNGYLLIAAFVSHCDFTLPDTAFEWALWIGFVVVTASGILGTYLAWALRAKHGIDERITLERVPARRAEIAREVDDLVAMTFEPAGTVGLPAPPHDAWIADLYADHLQRFLERPRHFWAHLIGSQRPLKRLTDAIDKLYPYVDQRNQEKLATIRTLVVEKDRLDFARVYLGLTTGWLLVHVPITYSLFVLSVLHGIVVYSFTSGSG
jgi:hypothetical protein